MKDDKFCFSKTLTYLVFMVAVIVGAFWFMNYANKQNINTAPEAGGLKCTWSKAPRTCAKLGAADNQTYKEDSGQNVKKAGAVTFYCCVLQKAAATTVGKTCRQKGGDWFRDTSATNLGKRLTTKWSKATATLISGAGDASYYPGKFCYSVAYKYTTEDAQGKTLPTCRAAGGTGWYRDANADNLSARLSTTGYTVPVAAVSGTFSDSLYYPNSHCYTVGKIQAKPDTTCTSVGVGGKWYAYSTCALATQAWNPNGYSNDNFVDVAHSDTRTGFSCCKQK
jgi:hypothetical protein